MSSQCALRASVSDSIDAESAPEHAHAANGGRFVRSCQTIERAVGAVATFGTQLVAMPSVAKAISIQCFLSIYFCKMNNAIDNTMRDVSPVAIVAT